MHMYCACITLFLYAYFANSYTLLNLYTSRGKKPCLKNTMLFFMTLLQDHERKCRFECCFETLSLIHFTSVTIGKYYFGTAKK